MGLIVLNALNNNSAGGASVAIGLLNALIKNKGSDNILLIKAKKSSLSHQRELIIDDKLISGLAGFLSYKYFLHKKLIALNIKIDFILNISDIPIVTSYKQFYLLDWPFFVLKDKILWSRMSMKEWLSRKIKFFIIKSQLNSVTGVITQTQYFAILMKQLYSVNVINVMPNAPSYTKKKIKFKAKMGFNNFGILSRYYSHKNFEIILELGRKLKIEKSNIIIYTTIEKNQGKGASNFINSVINENLVNIINLGKINHSGISDFYDKIDGVILPSLAESYSGNYVEAVMEEKVIITSNLNFATEVCGNCAIYFNPYSVNDLYNCLNMSTDYYNEKIQIANKEFDMSNSWDRNISNFLESIK